jgi:hypothetical protein
MIFILMFTDALKSSLSPVGLLIFLHFEVLNSFSMNSISMNFFIAMFREKDRVECEYSSIETSFR